MLINGEDQVHATSNRSLAIASTQSMTSVVNSIDRRRTRCVDGETENKCQ